MKNALRTFAFIALVAVIGFSMSVCDDGNNDNNNGRRDIRSSIQVNNQAPSRSIIAEDTVELYIITMQYHEDANPRALILISSVDGGAVLPNGEKIDNAGWYSVTADLGVRNDFNNGSYSSFGIGITKLKINEIEYDIQGTIDVIFGNPSEVWTLGPEHENWDNKDDWLYPDSFSGITITDATVSLKTVITVEPGILVDDGNGGQKLADKPFSFIKVEGRINE